VIEQLVGILLLFFITGMTFVYALFPRKGEMDPEYDLLYRLVFGVVMSIVILVLFGFSLNTLGTDSSGFGYVTAPNLWLGLGVISILFFLLGWWRGAYPWLGKIHKSLLRFPKSPPHSVLAELDDDKTTLARFRELAAEREKLRRELADIERRIKLQTGSLKDHYVKRRTEVQEKLRKTDSNLRELEEKRSEALYMR
jgi:hypothetical protein